MKAKIALFISLLMLFSCVKICFAVTVEIEDKSIPVSVAGREITAAFPTTSGSLCLITVVKKGTEKADLEGTETPQVYYQEEKISGESGILNISFKMSDAVLSGDYFIRIKPEEANNITLLPFAYYSIAERNELLKKINEGDFSNIDENRKILGLAFGDESGIDRRPVYKRMIDYVEAGGSFTADNIIDIYTRDVILEAVAQDKANFVIQNGVFIYDNYTKLSEAETYELYSNRMNENGVTSVNASIMGKAFSTMEALQSEFERQTLLAAFLYPQKSGYGHVGVLINDWRDALASRNGFDISFAIYDTLDKKTEFHQKLLDEEITSVTTFKTAFERLAGELAKPDTGNVTNGSHKGGGGGISFAVSTTVPEEPKLNEEIFTDMDQAQWAEEYVTALASKGILGGRVQGIFAPNDTITREEFAKIIVLAFNIGANNNKCSFKDVDKTKWYYQYIIAATENNIMLGEDEESFGVGKSITRQQAATSLYRLFINSGKTLENSGTEKFADDEEISEYAKDAVYALKNAGIISGVGYNYFSPNSTCSRAESAKLVYLLMKYVGGQAN